MARHAWLSVILLLGCGGESVPPDSVDFDRICGVDGPVPLLELAGDETVSVLTRTDDGEVFVRTTIQTTTAEGVSTLTVAGSWLIDACGEDRRAISPQFLVARAWAGLELACMDLDLVEIDDQGARVLARRGCFARESIGGVLVTRDAALGSTVGRLVAIRPGPDGAIVDTLLPEILVDPVSIPPLQATEDRVFHQTPDLALVSVDPRTGETVVEIERVARHFHASQRHVAYRLPPDDPNDENAPAPLFLRNRGTGADVTLAEDVPTSMPVVVDGAIVMAGYPASYPPPRWFRTADGSEILPPSPGVVIAEVNGDGLVWLARSGASGWSEATTFFRWPPDEEPRMVTSCQRCHGWRVRDSLLILEAPDPPKPRRLLLARSEGGLAFELAAPVGRRHLIKHDDRVLTVLDTVDEHGTLVLYDYRNGGAAQTIATNVHERALYRTTLLNADDELFYEQRDPDGGYTLYRARLPPAE